MSPVKYQFLWVNVAVLRYFGLWLDEDESQKKNNIFKMCGMWIILLPSWYGLYTDIFKIMDPKMNLAMKIQKILAAACVSGSIYMAICFYHNRSSIKILVDSIATFSKFTKLDLKAVDQKACFFSKIMLGYSFAGLLIYCSFPVFLGTNCLEEHAEYLEENEIPCRSVIPFDVAWDYRSSPAFEFMMASQFGTTSATCIFIVNSTMMVCGLLQHAVSQLKEVRKIALTLATMSDDRINGGLKFIVRHHCSVIEFIDDLNRAFGSQLVMHITLTSIVIGLLGFEILIVDHRQAVAYALHVIGWFVILYNVCHCGQLLIDESLGVAESVYFTPWYNSPCSVQKDIKLIILRAQKPLVLKALNIGILSEPTFLNVITSSYSYFALLFNMKNQ